jgi:hypothetical protein
MPKEQRREIENLPGWVWVYQGEEQWSYTTRKGELRFSTERHAKELQTGNVMSTGSARRVATANRDRVMRPVPAERNIGQAYPEVTEHKFHGNTVTIYFDNLEAARIAVQFDGILDQFPFIAAGYIGVYYSKKLEREGGTDTALLENGFAVLSPYYTKRTLVNTMEPWEIAEERIDNYELNQYSRVYVYGIET